jgi:hypothetical protein
MNLQVLRAHIEMSTQILRAVRVTDPDAKTSEAWMPTEASCAISNTGHQIVFVGMTH